MHTYSYIYIYMHISLLYYAAILGEAPEDIAILGTAALPRTGMRPENINLVKRARPLGTLSY